MSVLSQMPGRFSAITNITAATDSSRRKQLQSHLGSSILERPLNKTRGQEVSLNAFGFFFSEVVQYAQKRVTGIAELERRLGEIGYRVGQRLFEVVIWREKNAKRETKYLQMLIFIHSVVWKTLFGKQADSLERSNENSDEYMITDHEPIVNKFISVPKDFSQLNCAAFLAGIVEAILDGSQFPARVTAHNVKEHPGSTTLLIKFDKEVVDREKMYDGAR